MDIDAVVEDFRASRARGVPYPPAWFDRLSLEDAYRVQLGTLARDVAAGERHAGWKVGLTARAIREQFRVHEPCLGYLLDSGRIASGATLDLTGWTGGGFENELCLLVGRTLRGPGVDLAAARAAVTACRPALELVENRGDFTAQLAVALADNAQQRAWAVGPEVRLSPDADLAAVPCEVRINGEVVATATGTAVMGDPYESVVWLANKLATWGLALEAGQHVMGGSFTRQFPLVPGDRIETSFGGIGTVTLALTAQGR